MLDNDLAGSFVHLFYQSITQRWKAACRSMASMLVVLGESGKTQCEHHGKKYSHGFS
jgi:hypothetical protein